MGLAALYSTTGPLGWATPVAAVLLNGVGVLLALALARTLSWLMSPSYDLHKLPSPPVGDILLGHVSHLLKPNYHKTVLKWANELGPIFRIRILTDWTVVVADPAAVAHVLTAVPGRTKSYQLVDEVLGGPGKVSMFGTRDEAAWRNTRKATAPAFSMANVRRYYGGVLAAAGEMLAAIEAALRREGGAVQGTAAAVQGHAHGGGGGGAGAGGADAGGAAVTVNMEPLLQRLMARATLEGLLEVPDAPSVPGFAALVPNVTLLMAEANAQITDPIRAAFYATPIAPLVSPHVARCRRALKEVVAFHTNTAARLLARPEPSPDNTLLWACLHRLRHPRTGRRLTPSQLHPEAGMYTTAGFDTTASTLGWCLYAAALHPRHQDALAAELRGRGVFGEGAVVGGAAEAEAAAEAAEEGGGAGGGVRLDAALCPTPEDLARLPLLNAFVNEVMRLYSPTAVSAERISAEPVTVMGYTLPPKTQLWPITYALHMADRTWESPAEFRPERWLEDSQCAFAKQAPQQQTTQQQQQQQQQPKAAGGSGAAVSEAQRQARRFLPFGDGPKNCVGQNFGITVVRATLALLLSRYVVSLADPADADTDALTMAAVVTKLRAVRLGLARRA